MTDFRRTPETGVMNVTGSPPFIRITVPDFQTLQREAEKFVDRREGFAFRGYRADAEHEGSKPPAALITGLERACMSLDDGLTEARAREVAIIREFVRRAHHYELDVPRDKNYFEWLALMQHHGAPTRLLDWTYSLQVAAHFAMSKAARTDSDLEIWMLNTDWCLKASASLCADAGRPAGALADRPLRAEMETEASRVLLGRPLPRSVWPVNPFRLNRRLTLQKGLFLAPADPTSSFADNLKALESRGLNSNVVCFVLPRTEITNVGEILYNANVTETTLFPDLDGFARSLWTSARYLDVGGMKGVEDL